MLDTYISVICMGIGIFMMQDFSWNWCFSFVNDKEHCLSKNFNENIALFWCKPLPSFLKITSDDRHIAKVCRLCYLNIDRQKFIILIQQFSPLLRHLLNQKYIVAIICHKNVWPSLLRKLKPKLNFCPSPKIFADLCFRISKNALKKRNGWSYFKRFSLGRNNMAVAYLVFALCVRHTWGKQSCLYGTDTHRYKVQGNYQSDWLKTS